MATNNDAVLAARKDREDAKATTARAEKRLTTAEAAYAANTGSGLEAELKAAVKIATEILQLAMSTESEAQKTLWMQIERYLRPLEEAGAGARSLECFLSIGFFWVFSFHFLSYVIPLPLPLSAKQAKVTYFRMTASIENVLHMGGVRGHVYKCAEASFAGTFGERASRMHCIRHG
jgi:hypothetical protein